jgi:hypothetical protein
MLLINRRCLKVLFLIIGLSNYDVIVTVAARKVVVPD